MPKLTFLSSIYWRRPRGDAPPPPRSSRHANRKRQEKLRRLSVDTRACIRSLAGAIALGTLCLRWSCFDRVADLQWVRDRRGTQFPFVLKPYVSVCLIVYLSICLSVLCIHMLKDCVCVCVAGCAVEKVVSTIFGKQKWLRVCFIFWFLEEISGAKTAIRDPVRGQKQQFCSSEERFDAIGE